MIAHLQRLFDQLDAMLLSQSMSVLLMNDFQYLE